MATKIQKRYDTALNWSTVNPVLAIAEEGYESDTGKSKVGDGVTEWNSLDYQIGTKVPENAVFTDTIYDDTNVVKTTDIGTVTSAMLADTYLTTHQDISGKLDKNTLITAGTATKITYDANGLVTGGTSLTVSDIPDLSGTYLTSETSHADVLVDGDIGVTVQAYDESIVIDSSYVHTDNNFTTTEKNNLANQSGTNTGDQDATSVNLVGYSKPATTGPIGSADSTQVALGKLEKGLEDATAGGGDVNVQSDWNATDAGSDAYILNKPVNVSEFINDSGYLTSETSHADVLVDADIGSTVQAYDADTTKNDVSNTFTVSQIGTVTIEESAIDLSVSNNFTINTGGALSFTGLTDGQSGNIIINNVAITSISASIYAPSGLATTLSTAGYYVIGYYVANGVVYITSSTALTAGGA